MDAPDLTPRQQLALALRCHREGNLAPAESLYRQSLAREESADGLHLLGVLCRDTARLPEALDLIHRAIALNPAIADFHYNLGLVLKDLNRLEESEFEFRRTLALLPDDPDTLANLGELLYTMQRYAESLLPLQRAVELAPQMRPSWHNLGNALLKLDRNAEAARCFARSIELQPNDADEFNSLGVALGGADDVKGAVAAYERAFALRRDFVDPLSNAAMALRSVGELERAEKLLRRAVQIKPDYSVGWALLGSIVREWCRLDEALDCYRRAMQLAPADPSPHSNLLYSLHFHPDYDAQAILRESRRFDEIHARPLTEKSPPHENNADADRPLRIGYVSGDFRDHVVGWNLLPMFRRHDRTQFQIFAYNNCSRRDDITAKLKACCDGWREITSLGDDKAAQLIREDRIDILVDLSMHMAQNRMLLFARKPAPVQVTYLAYCSTTGLSAIDYRISDPYFDPPDSDLSCYCESTVRLPKSYWCFQPIAEPPIKPAPHFTNGAVTFGCLNGAAKISPPTLDAWAKILARCRNSRLILHCPQGPHRQWVIDRLCAAAQRRQYRTRRPSNLVEFYPDLQPHRCRARSLPLRRRHHLTRGPVDGRARRHPARPHRRRTRRNQHALQPRFAQLIAQSEDQYIQLALQAERWIELRPTLRDRMKASPLMDGGSFTRAMEAAFRGMWKKWAQRP